MGLDIERNLGQSLTPSGSTESVGPSGGHYLSPRIYIRTDILRGSHSPYTASLDYRVRPIIAWKLPPAISQATY